jgi:hypothetical protein
MTIQKWMVQQGTERMNGGKRRRGDVLDEQLMLPL